MAQAQTAQSPGSRIGSAGAADHIFRYFVSGLGGLVIVILFGLTALLVIDSWSAIQRYGFTFITSSTWDPVREDFGAWPYIYGTIFSSALALLISTPIAVGAALFLAEYAPPWLRDPVSYVVEMLAAIPSIIYGLWGFFVLAPVCLIVSARTFSGISIVVFMLPTYIILESNQRIFGILELP